MSERLSSIPLTYLISQLTSAQQAHLLSLKDDFHLWLSNKYAAGCYEHGGNVWDMTPLQLVDEALKETIDQFTYLYTLREKLNDPKK